MDQSAPTGSSNQQRLREIIDGLAPSMFVALLSPDGRVLEVNRNALQAGGLVSDDVIGRSFWDTYWWSYSAEAMQRLRTDIAKVARGSSVRYDVQARIAGDRFLWVDFAMYPLAYEAGDVTGIVASGSDITARKHTELALRDAKDRLEATVKAGRVGLWEWDPEADVVTYSPVWKEQLGHAADEIRDHPDEWRSRLHPDDVERAEEVIGSFVRGDAPTFEVQFRMRHRDGSYRDILSRGTKVVQGETGRLVVLGTHVDITEYAQLQSHLVQAQKLDSIGRLAGGIAHDFNNFVTVIKATAEVAMMGLEEGNPLRDDLCQIRDAGDRAAALTKQLLAFSRRQMLRPTILDLAAVVAAMQVMIRRAVGETIELVVRPPDKPPVIQADQGQIEQVLMNLAINARDAMPRGGRLTIGMRETRIHDGETGELRGLPPGEYVVLAVTDTGMGMDQATLARIFEPFFTTKETGKGTGLGLSTVFGIVEQSRGRIVVRSIPGEGTTFEIYLPLAREATRRSVHERTASPSRPSR